MRYLAVGLGLVVMAILGLVGFIHSRNTVVLQLSKSSYFESVKHKVSSDMLKELKTNIAEANIRLEQIKKQVVDLATALKSAQGTADGKKAEMNKCNDEMNEIKTTIGALEAEKNKTDAEFQQKKASLKQQVDNLKIEAEKRSKVCDYILKASVDGMKLCGIVPVIQAGPKPETKQR